MDEEKLRIRVENGNQGGSSMRSHLLRYGLVVVWAAFIFIGSGDVLSGSHTSILLRPLRWLFPGASPETLAFVHVLIRKAGHLTEYAILAILAARAFSTSSQAFLRIRWFWISLILVIAYSLSDEFHQMFVPTRGASIHDSMIDTVGGLIGLALVWLWRRRVRKNETLRATVSKATATA